MDAVFYRNILDVENFRSDFVYHTKPFIKKIIIAVLGCKYNFINDLQTKNMLRDL